MKTFLIVLLKISLIFIIIIDLIFFELSLLYINIQKYIIILFYVGLLFCINEKYEEIKAKIEKKY